MITVSWNGATALVLSRHSVKIGDLFDSFYEMNHPTPGLPFFELRWHATGFELWAGRRHLTIEVPPLARVIRGLAVRITDGIARAKEASSAPLAARDAADLSGAQPPSKHRIRPAKVARRLEPSSAWK